MYIMRIKKQAFRAAENIKGLKAYALDYAIKEKVNVQDIDFVVLPSIAATDWHSFPTELYNVQGLKTKELKSEGQK